ncbi:hypothetical protein KFE25_012213 [Diacronema lutheri]|uniref:Uncharacterized protein n=1 Tax=Diacronema lutheri TaxID=2081491 RepID=A0A8J5X9K7_DIALT|nr:hypothetical protein KFE25_012213 [Diacronema lutheri]
MLIMSARTRHALLYVIAFGACAAWVVLVLLAKRNACRPMRTIHITVASNCARDAVSLHPRQYDRDPTRYAQLEALGVYEPRRPYTMKVPPLFAEAYERDASTDGIAEPRVLELNPRVRAVDGAARALNVSAGLRAQDDAQCADRARARPFALDASYGHPRARSTTCAVVGSGGVLDGSRCGRSIDEADFVFRANNPPIGGYEADVGNRTDVLVLNRYWAEWLARGVNGPLRQDEGTREALLGGENRSWVGEGGLLLFLCQSLWPVERDMVQWLCDRPGESPVPYERSAGWTVSRSACEWARAIDGWLQRVARHEHGVATTGLHAVFAAAALCSEVRVYGFMPFDGPRHYFDGSGTSCPSRTVIHDFGVEHALLDEFAERGIELNVCEGEYTANAPYGSPPTQASSRVHAARHEQRGSQRARAWN